MKENSLKKNLMLKKRDDIAEVLKKGKRYDRGCIKLILLPDTETPFLKIAFLVSKKLGRKAVLRNKIKRWMREIFRVNKKYFPDHVRIIMTPTVRYEELDHNSLTSDFLEVVRSEKFNDYINKILPESNFSCEDV
ncbi:MAG: ribonuclease P protein component [Candidatus Delongbacteria bacterium]|nr:ribonuclease P protein component [Candidatus Delongbacteria bacterium]